MSDNSDESAEAKGGFMERTTERTRVDYNTPLEVVFMTQQLAAPARIGLDPCSNPGSIVDAEQQIMLENGGDGLIVPWAGQGLVYINPPYGRAIVPFVNKACEEARAGAEIVMLVPARTDTKWFQRLFREADAICFWRGRLTFLGAPDPAPFPSALPYFGPRTERFAELFGQAGAVAISSTVNSSISGVLGASSRRLTLQTTR